MSIDHSDVFSIIDLTNHHVTRPNGGSVFTGGDVGYTFNKKGGIYDIKDSNTISSDFKTYRASTLRGATLLCVQNAHAQNRYINIFSAGGQEQAIKDRLAELGHADTPANRLTYGYYSTAEHQADMGVGGVFGGMTAEPEKIPFLKPSHRSASLMIPPKKVIKVKKAASDMILISNGINGRGGGPLAGTVENPSNVPSFVSVTILEY